MTFIKADCVKADNAITHAQRIVGKSSPSYHFTILSNNSDAHTQTIMGHGVASASFYLMNLNIRHAGIIK
jgi:hypothetical protein